MKFRIKSISDWKDISDALIANFPRKIVGLVGSLGAGKTSLVKSISTALKIEDEVTSPTYSIVQEYGEYPNKIIHMDLYRINSFDELLDIGIEEYLHNNALKIIEWPQILIESITDLDYTLISIDVLESGERIVNIEEVN